MTAKNPYGNISRAAEYCQTLSTIWKGLTMDPVKDEELHSNIGVVSDGSFDTVKGQPYVLPVIFNQNKWRVDDSKKSCPQLRLEIKRLNKIARDNHSELLCYCRDFLGRNVINQEFIPVDQESSTVESSNSCEEMKL